MRPSSRRISHTAATGWSPASAHRSGPASVCPARLSTPPGSARSGKMCPGRTRSRDRVRGWASTRSVLARSKAEVPVLVPRIASTDSVNGVPNLALFWLTISLSCRRSATSGAIGAHRIPRPCLTVKFTISGVAFSAANTRSPSFSRSASSTTTIMRPAAIRLTAWSTVRNEFSPTARRGLAFATFRCFGVTTTSPRFQPRPSGARRSAPADRLRCSPAVRPPTRRRWSRRACEE